MVSEEHLKESNKYVQKKNTIESQLLTLKVHLCCAGHRPVSLLELFHSKISLVSNTPLSKHWPQLAAKAGQEFIFISWNSVDLKSLLNVNFQKTHASAF